MARAIALAGLLLAIWAGAVRAAPCEAGRIHLLTGDGRVSFAVELALTPEAQSRGLMFRPELAGDAGMLFVYPTPRTARFWMKNTMIPLDMIFLRDDGTVANVAAETRPYSRTPHASEGAVRAVLEINGGLAAELGIGPGTQAVHPAFRAAPEAHRCPPLG